MTDTSHDTARKVDAAYTVIHGARPGKRIGVVKYRESGYYLTDFDNPTDTLEQVREFVRNMNERLGLPADVADSMSYASCFGWDVPIANKAHEYFKQ